ncbi:hypothetical protein HI855_09055 [Cyanobacteria bacterium 150NLHA]|uniref:hypothetical protein n=1 Tax=unclassified Prochlorococcus TaxID=2627481 RepID=UPI0007B353E9|nr:MULTISPECIES: hypothetical protein [unclassified Prochlorococcus]NMO84673.1 hypothetical protein [Prochlorococcus sp. P1344]NMP06698.1 hypothetical protein [Prochlorococcus sp. P1361]
MIEDQKKLQTKLGVKLAVPIKSGDRSLIVPSLRTAWILDWHQNNSAQTIGFIYRPTTPFPAHPTKTIKMECFWNPGSIKPLTTLASHDSRSMHVVALKSGIHPTETSIGELLLVLPSNSDSS